jgi:type IV pilus assembly protein PilX
MIRSSHQASTSKANSDRSAPAIAHFGGNARPLVDAARANRPACSLTPSGVPYPPDGGAGFVGWIAKRMAGTMGKAATPGPPRSRGTVLVVGLLILVVMMLLGLNSMQTSVLEEMMASQSKQQNTAFHAAEAGMQAALSYLASLRKPPTVSGKGTEHVWPGCQVSDTSCDTTIQGYIASWKDFDPDAPKATLNGEAMSVLDNVGWSMNTTDVAPHFVIESRYAPPLEFEDAAKRKGYHFFTVAAVGLDPGTNSRAVLQSTITKLFP